MAHLLIVEDDELLRDALGAQLAQAGHRITTAADGAEALEQMRAGAKFDVGLFDMQMPTMDGIMLAREIRRLPGGQALPLILLSSIGRPPGPDTSELFAAVLTKPANLKRLVEHVRALLSPTSARG